MPVKRSRTGTSSIHLDAAVTTAAAAAVNPVKVMKTDDSASKILTFASPVNVAGEFDQLKIGGFLERCHYCKKRIAQNSEVFMYSTLCAFCSVECRDSQIAVDRSAEKQPENS